MFEDDWKWKGITNQTIVRMLLRWFSCGTGPSEWRREGARNGLNSTVIWLCSHCGWLLLKCSAIGIGFNGAETNCRIAHILGILLMNSCNTDRFLATTVVYGLSSLNIWVFVSRALLSNEVPVLLLNPRIYSNWTKPLQINATPFQQQSWYFLFFRQIRCKICDWKSLYRHCSTSNSPVNIDIDICIVPQEGCHSSKWRCSSGSSCSKPD